MEYKPLAILGTPDYVFEVGRYVFGVFGGEIQSRGMIRYLHILVVLDMDHRNDVLYVAAETNPLDGPDTIYLGVFDGNGHSTVAKSPMLTSREFFTGVASFHARERLGIPWSPENPMAELEAAGLAFMEEVFDETFPDGRADRETEDMLMALGAATRQFEQVGHARI